MTFDEARDALNAGLLEMMRPWGDYVRVRRRPCAPQTCAIPGNRRIPLYMEEYVEAELSERCINNGLADIRIAKENRRA